MVAAGKDDDVRTSMTGIAGGAWLLERQNWPEARRIPAAVSGTSTASNRYRLPTETEISTWPDEVAPSAGPACAAAGSTAAARASNSPEPGSRLARSRRARTGRSRHRLPATPAPAGWPTSLLVCVPVITNRGCRQTGECLVAVGSVSDQVAAPGRTALRSLNVAATALPADARERGLTDN